MRILTEDGVEITEAEADLTCGYLAHGNVVRRDEETGQDVYEEVMTYCVIPEEERRQQRLAELHRSLADTDYCVIKIAEGAATAEEYADTIAQRQAWRQEINELENPAAEVAGE